jgi:hypothetical protein
VGSGGGVAPVRCVGREKGVGPPAAGWVLSWHRPFPVPIQLLVLIPSTDL